MPCVMPPVTRVCTVICLKKSVTATPNTHIDDNHLMGNFHNNLVKLVSECLHSRFYWSKGWWRWWVVTTGAISHAKLQSHHHHQQTNIQFSTSRMPFLSVNQQCQSTEGKNITFHGPAYPKLTWGPPALFWPLNAPGYLVEGLPCLPSAHFCQ